MIKPVLFVSDATSFRGLGLGVLSDALTCVVTEERNGIFDLEMEYPITGRCASDIKSERIIYCKPNPYDDPEPFRIYRIKKVSSGKIKVFAHHLSYDLSGIIVSPFSAANAPAAMSGLKSNSAVTNPFDFYTDVTTIGAIKINAPVSVRYAMGGYDGSILSTYGGEYKYQKYNVRLLANRGADNGVSIRYGKNIIDLDQEENISSCYYGVYPYWISDEQYYELPEKIVMADGTYPVKKIMPLNLSEEFETKPSENDLRSAAQKYIADNKINVPKVSLTVDFVELSKTAEYADLAPVEKVKLCDTVTVVFPSLNVDAKAKVVSCKYNVLKNKYDNVTIGSVRRSLADQIADHNSSIDEITSPGFLDAAAANASKLITGNKGGYVVLHSSTGAATPDEILIMDQPTIEASTKIWRWNNSGLGYSSSGYNGTYSTAITQDGKIVADFIAAGTLDAAQITVINLVANAIASVSGDNQMSISASVFKLAYKNNWLVQIDTSGNGLPIIYMRDMDNGVQTQYSEITPHHIKIGGTSADPLIYISAIRDAERWQYDPNKTTGSVMAHSIGCNTLHFNSMYRMGTQLDLIPYNGYYFLGFEGA